MSKRLLKCGAKIIKFSTPQTDTLKKQQSLINGQERKKSSVIRKGAFKLFSNDQ